MRDTQSSELFLVVMTQDLQLAFTLSLGIQISTHDKIISDYSEDLLAVGVDWYDKSKYAFSLSVFSFYYNASLWVKHEAETVSGENASLDQLVIDWDNEQVYALGTVRSVYYLGYSRMTQVACGRLRPAEVVAAIAAEHLRGSLRFQVGRAAVGQPHRQHGVGQRAPLQWVLQRHLDNRRAVADGPILRRR